MDKEVDRSEYVLADFGYIWVGSAYRNEGLPWLFGQVSNNDSFYHKFISFASVLISLEDELNVLW